MNNFSSKGILKLISYLFNDSYLKALSIKKNKAPLDDLVKDEIKNLFEINESLLVFDIRDVPGVDSNLDNFVKEILLKTVRNIKKVCEQLTKESTTSEVDLNKDT